jgi:hypothetical protein
MFYFKDNTNKVHAIEDMAFASLLPSSCVEITEDEASELTAPPVFVPNVVTMRQARLALLQAGLINSIDSAILTMPSPQKEAALIEWNYSQEVHRDKELVLTLASILSLSEAQLDALFTTAATL